MLSTQMIEEFNNYYRFSNYQNAYPIWFKLIQAKDIELGLFDDRKGLICHHELNLETHSFELISGFVRRLLKRSRENIINLPTSYDNPLWDSFLDELISKQVDDSFINILALEYAFDIDRNPYTLAQLAKFYSKKNYKEIQKELLGFGLRKDKNSPPLLICYGQYSRNQGDPINALKQYQRVRSMDIDEHTMYVCLVAMSAAQIDTYELTLNPEDIVEARNNATNALEIRPDRPFAYNVLGRIAKKAGKILPVTLTVQRS